MTVFIGMETSGVLRRRFQDMGIFTVSADTLPAEDGAEMDLGGLGGHYQGDAFECLEWLWSIGRWPRVAVFHITCTYLTCSAEWAYKDPDFVRYPGVGYHQKLKPETLFGQKRRAAREDALNQFRRVAGLKIMRKAVENPKGALSRIRKPSQIIQPYQFGDDASKETHLWFMDQNGDAVDDMRLPIDPAKRFPGRLVTKPRCKIDLHPGYVTNHWSDSFETQNMSRVERWSNQTDSGQNRLTPGAGRWKERSRTYPGPADAMASHWSKFL